MLGLIGKIVMFLAGAATPTLVAQAAEFTDASAQGASSEGSRSHVPTWRSPRSISVGKSATFFSYVDRAGSDKTEALEAFDAWLEQQPCKCIGRSIMSGKGTSVVFHDLPSGNNYFSITCTGRCENVKYAISRNRSAAVRHHGVQRTFPLVHSLGATTYFHDVNIGFIFFEDAPNAPRERVLRNDALIAVHPDTRIVVQHWHNGVSSLLRPAKACQHAPPPRQTVDRVSLHKEMIIAVGHAAIPGYLRQGFDRDLMNRLRERGQQVALCTYGPAKPDGSGFARFHFWYGTVPSEMPEVIVEDPHSPFRELGVTAVQGCPADMREAVDARNMSIAAIPD